MASLQRLDQAPGKKRWLPIAVVAVIAAGAIAYSVLDTSDQPPAPVIQSPDSTSSDSEQNIQQAYRLTQRGLYGEALNAVNQILADNADNMDALLLQATLLAKTGNKVEAERRFNTLHEQYPERPEPLNNLAVLYAESGDSNRAIQTLQKAFKTHPSYDLIYQNLSDMYAVLAAEAYNKALGLSGTESGPQLATLDRFGKPTASYVNTASISVVSQPTNDASDNTPVTVSVPEPSPAVVETVTSPVVAEETATAVAPQETINDAAEERVTIVAATDAQTSIVATADNNQATEEQPSSYTNIVLNKEDSEAIANAQNASEAPIAIDNAEQLSSEGTSPEEQAIARETERAVQLLASLESGASLGEIEEEIDEETPPTQEDLVNEHLKDWAKAWSAQDVDSYLRAYVAGYKPNNATSHKQWTEQRRSRLTRPAFIKVELKDIEVTMLSDNRAEATFRQSYRSDRYRDVERKRVSLMRRSSGWKIVEEGKL